MENIIAKLIEAVLKSVSPQLRALIEQFIKQAEVRAKETANPWDDLVVMLLKYVLKIE